MKLKGEIKKVDDEQRLVFGWFSVCKFADGTTVIDSDNDTIDINELEQAVYDFVLYNREGGEMHAKLGVAKLVESIVFTPEKISALGLPENSLPQGWFGGFKVLNDDVWQRIKSGQYSMFSIGLRAIREAINDE